MNTVGHIHPNPLVWVAIVPVPEAGRTLDTAQLLMLSSANGARGASSIIDFIVSTDFDSTVNGDRIQNGVVGRRLNEIHHACGPRSEASRMKRAVLLLILAGHWALAQPNLGGTWRVTYSYAERRMDRGNFVAPPPCR